ncbi:efflux RND transporter permease subunit, partial [Hyphomonas oceanitis]
ELQPRDQWREGMSPEDLRTAISENLESVPGIVASIGQPIAMAVDELITGTRAELAVKIFGPDTEILLDRSQVLQTLLQQVDGAAEVQADQITGAPQLVV